MVQVVLPALPAAREVLVVPADGLVDTRAVQLLMLEADLGRAAVKAGDPTANHEAVLLDLAMLVHNPTQIVQGVRPMETSISYLSSVVLVVVDNVRVISPPAQAAEAVEEQFA